MKRTAHKSLSFGIARFLGSNDAKNTKGSEIKETGQFLKRCMRQAKSHELLRI